MANTHPFDSLVEQLVSTAIPLQAPAIPPCTLYCTPILLPGPVVAGKVNLPVVTNVQAVQTDPITFENSTDAINGEQPTLVTYSDQFGLDNPSQNSGLELRMLLQSHLTNTNNTLQTVINASVTGSTVATVSSAAFAVANLETLLASVPARSIVALASDYFVKVKPTWMPSGHEDKLYEISHSSGLPENTVGFVARPEAIALIYGYPLAGPGDDIRTSMLRLPCGLDVAFSRWYSRGGRQWRGSLDICFTAQVGQAAALKVMKSA